MVKRQAHNGMINVNFVLISTLLYGNGGIIRFSSRNPIL